jgi:hypothetical protein
LTGNTLDIERGIRAIRAIRLSISDKQNILGCVEAKSVVKREMDAAGWRGSGKTRNTLW